MANIARIRVELKKKFNDPYKNFKEMFQEFRRKVSSTGILAVYNEHRYHESESEKDRRKKRETVKRFQMEALADKIMRGEDVKAPSGLIKKVLNSHKKDKKRDRESQSQERYA